MQSRGQSRKEIPMIKFSTTADDLAEELAENLTEEIVVSDIPLWQWIFCAAFLLVFICLGILYKKGSVKLIVKVFKKAKGTYWEDLFTALASQISIFLFAVGIFVSVWNMPLGDTIMNTIHTILSKGMLAVVIALIAWACCSLISTLPLFQFKFLGNAEAVRRLLQKALKVLVILFAALIIMEGLGLPVTSLITGLGIGGLVISLAAQDTASNLIAGVVIIIEHPFTIGDWITCSQAEGTVEDITFRSTKIRTLANTLAIVPNSVISAEMITNGSERKMRMAEFTIGVCYDTPRASIEKVSEAFREMLQNDEDVVDDTVTVRLTGFSSSSIDILVRYYTKTTEPGPYMEVVERLNLEIIRIMEENHVEFAFPSTTVYFGGEEKPVK